MIAPTKKALDAAVARKAITAAKEQKILSRLSSNLSQRINQKGLSAHGSLRGFFRGPGGPASGRSGRTGRSGRSGRRPGPTVRPGSGRRAG